MTEEIKEVKKKVTKKSKFNFEGIILSLLIVVGLLQTAQLFGLRVAVANANVSSTPARSAAPTSVSAPTGSGAAQLPTMVGGC